MQKSFLTINRNKMKYASFGSGEKKAVIIPGVNLGYVSDTADSLEARFRPYLSEYEFFLFDRKDSDGIESISSYTDDIIDAFYILEIEKAHIYGFSEGGTIALLTAARYPERVISVCAASAVDRCDDKAIAVFESLEMLAKSGRVRELIEFFADKVFSESTARALKKNAEEIANTVGIYDVKRFIAQTRAIRNADISEEVGRITCPCLMAFATDDKVFSPSAIERLADINHFKKLIYRSASHGFCDETEGFTDDMMAFFAEN